MITNQIIDVIQTVILFGGFIIAIRQIILLSKQIRLMTTQIQEQISWQRKNVSFDYLKKYAQDSKETNINLQKKLDILKQDGKQIAVEDMLEKLKDPQTRVELYEIVSYFEYMAIGIQENYFDENIIKKAKLNAVISTYKALKPYLLLRRNETNGKIGEHFEQLALKWEKEN